MKRFHFPLERVRHLREQQAEAEQIKLQHLRGEREVLVDAARQIEERVAGLAQEIATRNAVDAAELRAFDGFRAASKRESARLAQRRQECEREIAKQLEVVVEARRKLRLLEKLKEKSRAEWVHAYNKELDELASEHFLARWSSR